MIPAGMPGVTAEASGQERQMRDRRGEERGGKDGR